MASNSTAPLTDLAGPGVVQLLEHRRTLGELVRDFEDALIAFCVAESNRGPLYSEVIEARRALLRGYGSYDGDSCADCGYDADGRPISVMVIGGTPA